MNGDLLAFLHVIPRTFLVHAGDGTYFLVQRS